MSDTKPVYKFINNTWVKQDAFQFTNGSWVRISAATTPLATPVISLSENILKIKRVDNATSYDVYVDGVLKTNVPVGGGVAMYKLNWGKYSSSSSVTFEIQVDDNPAYTQTVNQNLINLITEPRKSTQVKFSIANNGGMSYAITYDTQYLTDCIVEIPAGEESNAEYSYIIVKPQSDNALIYLDKGGPTLND